MTVGAAAPPKLSVVLACKDAAETIATQLDAFARQEWSEPWELIVADNGSTDGTLEVVRRYEDRIPNLRVVDASARRGAPYARNVGAAAARAGALAFCDADDEVCEGWLAAIGEALARHEFVAGRLDDAELNDAWVRETRDGSDSLPMMGFPPYAPFAPGACIGIRRRLHEAVGGFDVTLFPDDLDYSLRVQRQGATLTFVPDAVVNYRYRDTLPGIFRQAYVYGRTLAAVERKFKPKGARFPGQRRWLVSGWKPVFGLLRRAHTKGGRGRLVWLLGWQLGRYYGSVRFRVLAI